MRYSTVFAIVIALLHSIAPAHALTPNELQSYRETIQQKFSEQLTNPQKKNRRSLAQFGYDLSFFKFKFYKITEFIDPQNFGMQSYSKPAKNEKLGSLYTCRGGFMDFSHIRAGIDWSVFMTFSLLTSATGEITLPSEAGTLEVKAKNISSLSLQQVSDMAQKISFERLLWHEIASWHYHHPNHRSEQQSAFSIEDSYSNFLGTLIGEKVALRLLSKENTKTYEEVATEEVAKMIASLEPVSSIEQSMAAYDKVDRYKQQLLPESERNPDIWWDSKIVFQDQRYLFKRMLPSGDSLTPWLVPHAETFGCANVTPVVLKVPQSKDYIFKITPSDELFFSKKTGEQLHSPFKAFTTDRIDGVIQHVKVEMEEILHPGFDTRDLNDPIPGYHKVKWMWFHKERY